MDRKNIEDLVNIGVSKEVLKTGRYLAAAIGAMEISPFGFIGYQDKDL